MTGMSSSNGLSKGDELSSFLGFSLGNGLPFNGFNNVPTTDALLLQDGFYLLLQDGGHLLLNYLPGYFMLLEGASGDLMLEDGVSHLMLEG